MVLLQLCAIAGFLLQFWCNSGAILVQFDCNFAAILLQLQRNCTCDWAGLATGLERRKISNTYRYWPGAVWKLHRAPPQTNQARKNTRRKDAWWKSAQCPGRSDFAVSRFPIFQHWLSHALNIPFLEGIVNAFFEGCRGSRHNRWNDDERVGVASAAAAAWILNAKTPGSKGAKVQNRPLAPSPKCWNTAI